MSGHQRHAQHVVHQYHEGLSAFAHAVLYVFGMSGEVKLWKDYLVYAQLFGIADKVAKQFQKLYPAEFDKMARESGLDSSTLLYTMNWANTMSTRAFNNAVAKTGSSKGFGGGTSFGGGGGFSGGGFGGGAR